MKNNVAAPPGKPKEMPAGLDRALMWDLSPLRPEQYDRTQAARWLAAVSLVNAYRDGIADADAEAR